MKERNIKLTLAYDGTDFVGWQVQRNGRSVQGELESALTKLHGHSVGVNGAGRTDSGVHASGQVANFLSDIETIPEERYVNALNGLLPRDVRILESRQVPEGFHARYDARVRTYRYYFASSPVLPWPLARYTFRVAHVPSVSRLNRMAAALLGEHDFSTFSGPIETNWVHDAPPSHVRTVYAASVRHSAGRYVFEISANGFLWKMVRSIVGTLIELDERDEPVAAFTDALAARERGRAGTTAPAWGLFLHRVDYEEWN